MQGGHSKSPLVSFIIPAFNSGKTIEAAVNSIREGNLEEGDEIIVVDDGSTDETAALLRSLADQDRRVRAFFHEVNKGGGAARNTAVKNAKHELVFCLDSDNLLSPGSVNRLKEALAETGADVAVFQEVQFFKRRADRPAYCWRFRPGWIFFADHLWNKTVPASDGNYLFTKESWERAGGYPEFARALDAWGFGFRQAATGAKIFVVEGTHYMHRYGHASYWMRESDRRRDSELARRIVTPFRALLAEEDVAYLDDPEASREWFADLAKRPLHVRSADISPEVAQPPGEVVPLTLGYRLQSAVRRGLGM